MPNTILEMDGLKYELDYSVQPATGFTHEIMRDPYYFEPAYVYDLKAYRRCKHQLVEITNVKTINQLTTLLNKELQLVS
jgi:hypothetical protein